MSESREHIFNANLFWMPLKDLEALAGFRYTHVNIDSSSTFLDDNTATAPPPTHYTAAIPKEADTSEDTNEVAERLELRYTHFQNWLFICRGRMGRGLGRRSRARSFRNTRPRRASCRRSGPAKQGHELL